MAGLLRDARINAVTVIDDHRLMFDLAEPNPALDIVLAGPIGRVFSIEAARVDPSAFIRSPVGTGPFIMEPWEIGQPVKLSANSEYWRTGSDGTRNPGASGSQGFTRRYGSKRAARNTRLGRACRAKWTGRECQCSRL